MGQMRTIKSMISRIGVKNGFFATGMIKSTAQYTFNPTVTVSAGTLKWVCDQGYGTVVANVPNYPFNSSLLKTMNITGVDAVTNLVINFRQVTYFSGTGWTSLIQLNIADNENQLSFIDLTSCTALKNLYLTQTAAGLTALNIANNTLLETYSVTGNGSYSFVTMAVNYFEHLPNLYSLSLIFIGATGAFPNFRYGAPIISASINSCRFTGVLDYTGLQLMSVDVRFCPNLTSVILTGINSNADVYIQSNALLTNITFPSSIAMRRLFLNTNAILSSLDVSGLTNLNDLDIANCPNLKYVQLTQVGKMNTLWMYGNSMSTAQTDAMIQEFKNAISLNAASLKMRNNRSKNIIITSTTTAVSGTNGKLVDTSKTFITTGVVVGDLIIAGGTNYGRVTAVLSETQLTVNSFNLGVETAGVAYTIDNSAAAKNLAIISNAGSGMYNKIIETYIT